MKKLCLLIVLSFWIASIAMAQDEVKPAKFENVEWYQVVLIDFKQGTVGKVQDIIEQYEAAGKEAGTPGPELYWMSTGEYDVMAIWKLDNGPADMEWKISPNDVKWWDAFVKQQGSEEAAQKLQQEFAGYVNKSTSYLSRKVQD